MRSGIVFLTITCVVLWSAPAFSAAILEGERFHPVQGEEGMAVTSHFLASKFALDVLQKGGNAVDAAVTAAFTLAVVQPRSGNIGGGGLMLYSSVRDDRVYAIDYREKAPMAATEKMFQNKAGEVEQDLSRFSHLAAGVPGTVAGLAMALEKFGTISLQEAMQPAITLAENGFLVTPRFSDGLKAREKRLKKWPATRKLFYKENGAFYEPGDRFVQKELAATLRRISANGYREFYEGETAGLIAREMAENGGLITKADMAAYTPVLREPVMGTYRGYDVYSMPPPSSGGAHIVQILNILEGFPMASYGHNSAQTIHLMAEAMKFAYADRSKYLGDEDFVAVPLAGLTSKKYAAKLRRQINAHKAIPSSSISPGAPLPYESGETTHFSIVDRDGNAVSNTYTINFSYGSGVVVGGAGFLLNNEMDDFSAKPGVPNAYGLIGGTANRIEPGKRMLSSMSPTLVKKDGKLVLVTGSPGGSRIITTTLQIIMNLIDHDLNIQSAVSAPRIHHQWLPDELRVEEGLSPDTITLLEAKGHDVVQKSAMGASQSITVKDGVLLGGADPRRTTSLAEGF
jgi:gamma-glutamyltranspeptidase/glutathione hydrolase